MMRIHTLNQVTNSIVSVESLADIAELAASSASWASLDETPRLFTMRWRSSRVLGKTEQASETRGNEEVRLRQETALTVARSLQIRRLK